MAKDFTKQAQGSIFDAVMPQGMQPEEEAQVAREAQEAFQTQGKEGFKMMRLNMAFTPSNTDFIRVMSRISGMSMTRYVNSVIEKERQRNGETYEKAKALLQDQ